MKCPYRKRIRTYPDGMAKITEADFSDCIENSCPYWGTIRYGWDNVKSEQRGRTVVEDFVPTANGCRKAEKECS